MNIVWTILLAGLVAWYLEARQKRKAKRAATPQQSQWEETETEDPETDERIIRFQCPNPATADFGLIQEFLDHEFFMPKIEHYLGLAKEMNAPAAVIEAIGSERSDELLIGLYQGLQSEIQQWSMNPGYTPNTFSALSATNYGANGERYGDLSLYWHGPDGLLARHKRFEEWLAKDRMVVTTEVLFTALDLHELDLRDKFAFHGRHFFIRSMNVSLKKNRIDPAEVEFVEA